MITFAVMAHERRRSEANRLAAEIGNCMLVMDTGEPSQDKERRNGDAAWSHAHRQATLDGNEWCCVLQDDALPIDDFIPQAESALDIAPFDCISFYLGTGTYPDDAAERQSEADQHDAAWLHSWSLHYGVAIAIRTRLIPDLLHDIAQSQLAYDYRIGEWFRQRRQLVGYTNPSLVDHADTTSLLHQRAPRKAIRTGARDQWNKESVPLRLEGRLP